MDLRSLFSGATGRPRDLFRATLGAGLALVAAGLTTRWIMDGGPAGGPLLLPPMGASAVLAFAIPASPLAQPRSIVGGNLVSALAGLACAYALPHQAAAVGVAVAAAILAMSWLRCLHPPGGAVALGAALSAPQEAAHLLALVACGSVLLVALAWAWGRVTRHPYPHKAPAAPNVHATRDPAPGQRIGFSTADVDAALAHYGELIDVSREDLDALFREVELQAHRRIHSRILCGEIMSRDVLAVQVEQSADSALAFLQQHDLRTAPVVDEQGRVVGMARRAELAAARSRKVGEALDPFVHRVKPGTAIEALLPLLSSGAAHEAMVVDDQRRLIGVITQTDLLAVLYRAHIVEAVAAERAADGGPKLG
jgi:CBS domain-containing membrane protein